MVNKKHAVLYIVFGIIIFLVAATNTIPVIVGLIFIFVTLIAVSIVSFFTDKYSKVKVSHIAATLLLITFWVAIAGVCTHTYQERLNAEKADKFIAQIEKYKSVHGHYPTSKNDLILPIAYNGLYIKEFDYFLYDIETQPYIIKYFDGFWDTKVYRSDEKKWYTDD